MKKISLIILSTVILLPAFSQSLPKDSETKKVCYSGVINSGTRSKTETAEMILNWITDFNAIRGQFGALYYNNENGTIKTTLSLNVTQNLKTTLWWINAAVYYKVSDGEVMYKITNFYTYSSVTTYRNLYAGETPQYVTPLEENNMFNIEDVSKTNDYAKILNDQVTIVIASLEELFK